MVVSTSPKEISSSSSRAKTKAGRVSSPAASSPRPKRSQRNAGSPGKRRASASPSDAPRSRSGAWGGASSNFFPTGTTVDPRPSSISNFIVRQQTRSSASRMKQRRSSADSFNERPPLEEIVDVHVAIEQREIVEPFAGADKTRWNSKFILNCNDDPTFAASIEFCHDQSS